jgi:hypothetical protein
VSAERAYGDAERARDCADQKEGSIHDVISREAYFLPLRAAQYFFMRSAAALRCAAVQPRTPGLRCAVGGVFVAGARPRRLRKSGNAL